MELRLWLEMMGGVLGDSFGQGEGGGGFEGRDS